MHVIVRQVLRQVEPTSAAFDTCFIGIVGIFRRQSLNRYDYDEYLL